MDFVNQVQEENEEGIEEEKKDGGTINELNSFNYHTTNQLNLELTHSLSDLKDRWRENSILSGGLIGYFANKKGKLKSWIMLGLYFAAVGALGKLIQFF